MSLCFSIYFTCNYSFTSTSLLFSSLLFSSFNYTRPSSLHLTHSSLRISLSDLSLRLPFKIQHETLGSEFEANMFPFQSPYGLYDNWLHQSGFAQEEPNWGVTSANREYSIVSSLASKVEKNSLTSTEACKSSHKEAERRRRQRINAHLSTLRTLLPNSIKTDKASLLAEVVHHVKELRRQAADVIGPDWISCSSGGSENESWPFPGESDELTLSYCDSEERLVKATLCCEERPGLNRDLTRAISSVRARAVRAEMMTVGGRTSNVVVMERAEGGGEEEMAGLRRALRAVVENRDSSYGLGRIREGNKRARVGGLVNPNDECDDNMSYL